MPAERVAMRQVREIIRLKFSAGVPTREIARRLGVAASTVRGRLRRFEDAGLSWPLPVGMSDGDPEAALYANHGTKRGHRCHAEPDWPTVHRELKRKHVTTECVSKVLSGLLMNLSRPRRMEFGKLPVEIGIAARGIAPRYIDAHAILLYPSPDWLVVEQGFGAANGDGEIFARDWPELDSGGDIAGDGHLVGINDGVGKPADAGHDGNRAIAQGTQLRQSARFESRWYQECIRPGLNEMGQILIIANHHADLTRMGFCGRPVARLEVRVASAQQGYLHALAQNERQIFQEQIKPLLPGHATDQSEQECIRREAKAEAPL